MKCPCCLRDLVLTHYDRYETVEESISGELPSMKAGYQCTAEFCIANNLCASWTEDGQIYLKAPLEIKLPQQVIEKCSKSGVAYAVGSFLYEYSLMKNERHLAKKTISVGKWKIVISPNYKIAINNQWKKRRFSYSVELWKKHSVDESSNLISISRFFTW